jgi:hypothetical protein
MAGGPEPKGPWAGGLEPEPTARGLGPEARRRFAYLLHSQIHIYIMTHTHMDAYIHPDTYIYIYMYIYVYMYIYTYRYTSMR